MGSLASSILFKTVPLMDPFAWLEHSAATHRPTMECVVAVSVVLAIYSVLGRFFCGWVCPMDMLFSLFERKLNRPKDPPLTRFHKPTRAEKIVPPIMMGVYLVLSVLLGQPFFTSFSPVAGTTKLGEFIVGVLVNLPGATMGLILAYGTIAGISLLVNIIAEYVFGIKRFWCKFVCPIGNFYGFIMNKYSPLAVQIVKPEKCVRCNLCSMVCPMSIDIVSYINEGKPTIRDHRCFHCGRCVEVCPYGVLRLWFWGGKRMQTRKGAGSPSKGAS
jgi:ferredoxin-type protein NapH